MIWFLVLFTWFSSNFQLSSFSGTFVVFFGLKCLFLPNFPCSLYGAYIQLTEFSFLVLTSKTVCSQWWSTNVLFSNTFKLQNPFKKNYDGCPLWKAGDKKHCSGWSGLGSRSPPSSACCHLSPTYIALTSWRRCFGHNLLHIKMIIPL